MAQVSYSSKKTNTTNHRLISDSNLSSSEGFLKCMVKHIYVFTTHLWFHTKSCEMWSFIWLWITTKCKYVKGCQYLPETPHCDNSSWSWHASDKQVTTTYWNRWFLISPRENRKIRLKKKFGLSSLPWRTISLKGWKKAANYFPYHQLLH